MKQVKLNDVIEFARNGAAIKQSEDAKGFPISRIETIWNSTIDEDRLGYADIFDEDVIKYEKYLLKENDILITHINSPKHLGKSAIYTGYPEKLIHGMNLLCLRNNPNFSNSKYLFYYFQTKYFKNQIHKISNQSVNQASFAVTNLKELEIPLPNLATQQKIANILDKADELRQYNKQLIEKYDALTQSLFLDMFGDPVKNEKGWEKKSLGEITDLITDGKHGNCNDEPGSGYYFVSAKDIRNNKINYTNSREIPKLEFKEVDKRTNLQPGDLVMINTGATIGRMAIAEDIPETRRSTFQKSVAVIKVKNDVVSSFFLKFVIELGLKTFANMGSGSAIKNLLLSEMRRFNIIVPNLKLQNQFAERVAIIEAQKQQAQEALAKSEVLFQGLLQQAFNGELT